ncbi:MAG: aspartyl protease family protein [Planctomycetes bacterium]|nr:aspartyl protease family protein [Planctomycetota bacterium]
MFPAVDLEVAGTRGKAKVRAILDTGFTGFLCLPTEVAVQLGLELKGRDTIEYADGTQKQELYFTGKVRFKGATRTVVIFLTDSDEALAGMELLEGCRVLIDVPAQKVRISRIAKTKKSDETKGE